MHRRLLSATAIGALLLGLAACGDPNDGPVTTPPPDLGIEAPSDGGGDPGTSDDGGGQSDGGGDDAPTADAPAIPAPDPADFAGMDEHTAEGAEQAFRYYIAVSMWAHQTGDVGSLTELQTADCKGCNAFNGDIEMLEEKDLLWSEADISGSSASIEQMSTDTFEVRYLFTLDAHSRPNNEGTERVDVETLDFDSAGRLSWTPEGWQVEGLSIEWGSDVH